MATAARPRPSRPAVSRGSFPWRRRRTAVVAVVAALGVVPLAACTPTDSSSSSSSSTRTTSYQTVVVISAPDDTCWTATVDGRKRTGCGDAKFTDRKGSAGATVVKTTDGSRVRVRIVVDGRTVESGTIWGSRHSVSVVQSQNVESS